MFYLCTCIVGVSAVYKYKRMYTLGFDSSGAQNGGQELHFGGFKWGRHCCLHSIAHCAVDCALAAIQVHSALHVNTRVLSYCAALLRWVFVFYIGSETLAIPIVVFYRYRL